MQFDAAAFMNATVNDANATKIPNVPAGEYIGQIQPVTAENFETGVSGPTSKEPGKPWTRFIYKVKIQDPKLIPIMQRDTASVRGDFFLELTEQGAIKTGEGVNVGLGRLREAANLNVAGQPFSFGQLSGQMVKIKVGQRADQKDPTMLYDEIQMVTKPY